jgi:hypothetical protein
MLRGAPRSGRCCMSSDSLSTGLAPRSSREGEFVSSSSAEELELEFSFLACWFFLLRFSRVRCRRCFEVRFAG